MTLLASQGGVTMGQNYVHELITQNHKMLDAYCSGSFHTVNYLMVPRADIIYIPSTKTMFSQLLTLYRISILFTRCLPTFIPSLGVHPRKFLQGIEHNLKISFLDGFLARC